MVDTSANFTGRVPEYYDQCLGPAWFDQLAADIARRLPANPSGDVLELACGTGLVTRYLRERLDSHLRLVATDLSPAMLDYARRKLTELKNIEWREADAARLPFADGQFGAVVCAFGFMFVPDKNAAFSEAFRVLKTGGRLLFSVWDRIEENPHALANRDLIERLFPGDEEMRFTVPFDMHDPALLRELLTRARFADIRIEKKRIDVDRVSARTIAVGVVRGTPRSLLFEKRGVSLDEIIDKITATLTEIGGADPYRSTAQVLVIEAHTR
jgi:SAM-dependent methyltransferase